MLSRVMLLVGTAFCTPTVLLAHNAPKSASPPAASPNQAASDAPVVRPDQSPPTPTPNQAAAVDSANQASPASSGVGDIVVTAQRRAERLQDVPVAVSAFNQAAIEARSITSLTGISGLAPNVKFANPAGYTTYSAVAIRGAYELNAAPFYDQPTGIYIDGIFIGKAQGAAFDIADIASIEVLRGPQGTLFGRNTRNLTKDAYRIGGFDFGPAFGNLTLGFFNPPRTYGIDATLSF